MLGKHVAKSRFALPLADDARAIPRSARHRQRPNQLSYQVQGEAARVLERGMPYLSAAGLLDDRIGAGHPEGLFEAWANLYYRFAIAMEATDRGDAERLASIRYPDIAAGVEGVRWVENCVRSADAGGVWVDYR